MQVLLKSPQTTEKIILPLSPSTPLSEIQNYIERNPPLPSDLSWDILSPVSSSSFIPTFTRPPVEERRDLRKAILLRTREELDRYCQRLDTYEQRRQELQAQVAALETQSKARQASLEERVKTLETFCQDSVSYRLDHQLLVVKFETLKRLHEAIYQDLRRTLDSDLLSTLDHFKLGTFAELLEALYSHRFSPTVQTSREQLLGLILGVDLIPSGASILPVVRPLTRRKQAVSNALEKLPRERLVLGLKIYYLINKLQNGSEPDTELVKDVRNRPQHPRPSIATANYLISELEPARMGDSDKRLAQAIVDQHAVADTGDPKSSLFGQADDPQTADLLRQMGHLSNIVAAAFNVEGRRGLGTLSEQLPVTGHY